MTFNANHQTEKHVLKSSFVSILSYFIHSFVEFSPMPIAAIETESELSHHRINNYVVLLNALVFRDVLEKWNW